MLFASKITNTACTHPWRWVRKSFPWRWLQPPSPCTDQLPRSKVFLFLFFFAFSFLSFFLLSFLSFILGPVISPVHVGIFNWLYLFYGWVFSMPHGIWCRRGHRVHRRFRRCEWVATQGSGDCKPSNGYGYAQLLWQEVICFFFFFSRLYIFINEYNWYNTKHPGKSKNNCTTIKHKGEKNKSTNKQNKQIQ